MSVDYLMIIEPAFVRLVYSGEYSAQAMLTIIEDGLEAASGHSKSGVLFDVSAMSGEPPCVLERFYIGVMGAKAQRRRKPIVKMAVYGREPMVHPQRFGETVALNRYALVKVCTRLVDAIRWLSDGDDPPVGHRRGATIRC